MTWTEINKQNELNAMKIAYSEQKSQIIREFEGIKEEVKRKLICVMESYFMIYVIYRCLFYFEFSL